MQDSLFKRTAPPLEAVQSVSKIVDYIRRIISQNKILAGLRVRGEVWDLNQSNGTLYFYLKEGKDLLKCVVWGSNVAKLPSFKNGDEIICGGDFEAYLARSEYELVRSNPSNSAVSEHSMRNLQR